MASSTDSASTVLVNSVTSYATTVNTISAPSESNPSVPRTSATPQRSNRLRRRCRSIRLRVDRKSVVEGKRGDLGGRPIIKKKHLALPFSSRRRHTRCLSDWSSDVCSSDLKDQCHAAAVKQIEKALQVNPTAG